MKKNIFQLLISLYVKAQWCFFFCSVFFSITPKKIFFLCVIQLHLFFFVPQNKWIENSIKKSIKKSIMKNKIESLIAIYKLEFFNNNYIPSLNAQHNWQLGNTQTCQKVRFLKNFGLHQISKEKKQKKSFYLE